LAAAARQANPTSTFGFEQILMLNRGD